MSNTKRGELSFSCAGKTHGFKFGMNAMCAFKDETGTSILKALRTFEEQVNADPDDVDLNVLRVLFACGVVSDEPVSARTAGDMMDGVGIQKASDMIIQAAKLAFPQETGGDVTSAGKPTRRKKTAAKSK